MNLNFPSHTMHNSLRSVRGILLAGGNGSRLAPLTEVVSKQLLPVYDQPMIHYPLVAMMLAGARDILLISTPQHLPDYQQLLGTGQQWGIQLHFAAQPSPGGLPQAFQIGADFVGETPVILMLGDNIFLGGAFTDQLARAAQRLDGATLFVTPNSQPSDYGVIELGTGNTILSLEEKPTTPKSKHVITGAYCFDSKVVEYAKSLQPSKRGELEMVDLLQYYHAEQTLRAEFLDAETSWYDAGTPQLLLEASLAVATSQAKHGKIGCPKRAATAKAWI